MKFFRGLLKAVSLVLVVVLTATAIFFRNNGVNTITLKGGDDIRAESVCADIKDKAYEKAAESGYLQLYFDKKTTAVMVKETSGGKKWYSMPNGTESAVVNMTVEAEDGRHILNSQSNSVKFSSFEYELKTDGVSVRYKMADDEKTANKEEYQKTDIAYSVCVDFTLKDGNFFVDAAYENLSKNENCAVSDFSVLPFFGAFKSAEKDDFLLIPDGCGAVAKPYYEDGESEYSCRVYGDDYAVENKKSNRALMGTFGMKRGENAYAVIIDSSQEYASIKAVSSKDGYSRVFASFAFDFINKKDKSVEFLTNSNPSVSICYKFLSRGNATYSDIAAACREQLIRNGILSTSSIESFDDVPMTLEITGAYKAKRWSPKLESYTTFEQAEDIIRRIKAKGVNNLSIRYSGIFESNSTEILSSLGGKNGLKHLVSFADSQNVGLYPALDILTYDSAFGKADFSAARSMNKYPLKIAVSSQAGQNKNLTLRSLKRSNKYIDAVIDSAEDYENIGFCINDAGRILSSDFAASGAKRTAYKNGIMAELSALSGAGKLMVDAGNVYTVKGSSSVVNVPMSVSYEESERYSKIPFVQTMLHGMTVLSSPALNISENGREAVLRCIEYGLCPSFSVVYAKPEGSKKNIEFESAATEIISDYTEISDALESLEGERIAEHSQVKNGVYCTTYSNSTRIYVNYNDSPATVNGVTVPANGCIRVG